MAPDGGKPSFLGMGGRYKVEMMWGWCQKQPGMLLQIASGGNLSFPRLLKSEHVDALDFRFKVRGLKDCLVRPKIGISIRDPVGS